MSPIDDVIMVLTKHDWSFFQANADMYFDATFAYRFYRKSLESVLSLDGLTKIQKVVDENVRFIIIFWCDGVMPSVFFSLP